MSSSLGTSGRPESSIMVLVHAAEPLVGAWRAQYDPRAPVGVPAHVTVLYPFLAPDDIDDDVVAELRLLLTRCEPFAFRLSRAGRFPGVLYLVPEPAEPFVAMTDAIAHRWPEAPPYGGTHASVIPHLTVAHLDDSERLDEIERVILPALPIETAATSAYLMVQGDDGRWWVRARLALGSR